LRAEEKYARAQLAANTAAISRVERSPSPNSSRLLKAAVIVPAGSRAAAKWARSTIQPTR